MANLAIKGHSTRGSEVIALLEMLGGKNIYNLTGSKEIWYILSNHTIKYSAYLFDEKGFTLERFLEKFPYKVGDKVQHKKATSCCTVYEIEQIKWEDNQVKYIICDLYWKNCKCTVTSEDLQPYKEETMENKPDLLQQLKYYFDNTPREVIEKEWHEYDKYNEIGPRVNEYLEYVNNIIQPQYPKTYIECAKILNCFGAAHIDGYKNELLDKFQELLICRDAYWKIAGEQMGLGKPWEPDWSTEDEIKYVIEVYRNNVRKNSQGYSNTIFAFPTKEIRDTFYKNFKKLIENCKELL